MDSTASFARWIDALNHPRDRARLTAAVDDAVRIERHGPLERGAEPGAPAEVIEGVDAAERWLRRMEKVVTWTLVGEAASDGDGWRAEYHLRVGAEDFENGGEWIARLADDGRIAHLDHRPFPVGERYR